MKLRSAFADDAIRGLSQMPKSLPCKYLYDERGSKLFDAICEQPEYYPTRTELRILEACGPALGELVGKRARVVEFGTGSGRKTRALLDRLIDACAFVPIDISEEQLTCEAEKLAAEYPHLDVLPLIADYTQALELPKPRRSFRRTVAFFPGSTLGNLVPNEAEAFLRSVGRIVGPDGALILGIDLKKEPALLHAAYNDRAGVTAEFNRNVLLRMNRELGANFRSQSFSHYAFYNCMAGRIEMHLVSQESQTIHFGEHVFAFAEGEPLVTEYSYKYTANEVTQLALRSGFKTAHAWTDSARLFSVQYLVPDGSSRR